MLGGCKGHHDSPVSHCLSGMLKRAKVQDMAQPVEVDPPVE